MEPLHHPERKEFQIDRIILFTDAVFAIAITLLVIEIHVPEIPHNGTEKDFWMAMLTLVPKFVGFIVSFFFIGLYWKIHHTMFGFVVNYTSKLIWLNLIFLLSIVLMPFSTAVYSEYSTPEYAHLIAPFVVYAVNVSFSGVMNYILLNYIYNVKNKVAAHLPSKMIISYSKRRALAIPIIFTITVLLTIIFPGIGRAFLFTIPIVMRLLRPKNKIKK